MPLAITPAYAGLFALFLIILSLRVIGMRRSARVSLGDGGNPDLMRCMRVQGNFIEYVPLILILMLLAELLGQPSWIIHAIGLVLLAGRLAHAYGVGRSPQVMRLRVLGMVLTLTALVAGAVVNLTAALAG